MDLDQWIDHVKERANIMSDRRLSELCELNETAVFHYRKRGALPSDETMLKMAALADFDAEDALLLLNIWRTTGKARSTYERMRKRAMRLGIGLAACSIPLIFNDVHMVAQAQVSHVSSELIIMRNYIRRFFSKLRGHGLQFAGVA